MASECSNYILSDSKGISTQQKIYVLSAIHNSTGKEYTLSEISDISTVDKDTVKKILRKFKMYSLCTLTVDKYGERWYRYTGINLSDTIYKQLK